MLKIMIVDNETAIRKGLVHCIRWETLGCVVAAQAVDGIDALEQLSAIQPDIIISDIRMPGMDGLELARQVSERYPHIKLIILTGFPDFEYAQRAIEYRVVDFVLKPTSVESLTQAIEKAKARIEEEQSSKELAQRLANKSEQNLMLERGMLLHDLMHRVELSHLYVLNRMAQLSMDLSSYHVLRLEIAPLFADETREADMLPCLQQAKEVLQDSLDGFCVYFAPYGDQACYAVVCTPDTAALAARCAETVDILGSLPRFSLYIGISSHFTDPLLMADAVQQADQAMQFARYSAAQPVASYQQLPEIPPQAMQRVFEGLRLMKSAVENQNLAASQEILRRLFAFMRETGLPVENIRTICLYVYQFCLSLLFLPSDQLHLSAGSEVSALKQLIDGNSADQLERIMQDYVRQMIEQSGGTDGDADVVVRTVQSYIAQHCAEDLSLEQLAGMVYLSPSYLSRLFKRETGENLSSYIQNVRIEQAKLLLRTTSLKTYEVAERVGISDPVYFSRIFKKITGVKPKDYRRETDSDPDKS